MKKNIKYSLAAIALVLVMGACTATPEPTQDVAAIQTQSAATVEARFTEMAKSEPTAIPPTKAAPPTATKIPLPSPTDDPTNQKPCFSMTWVSETIPDGMLMTPGTTFTKTWTVRNDGNCVWDPSYVLEFRNGDAMTDTIEVPLTRSVYPDDTYDISLNLVAPTDPGTYTGYWSIKTPFGGYMGVGSYNQNLYVKIEVSEERRLDDNFDASTVVYDWSRNPVHGCGANGAYYQFKAVITANGPGRMEYRWDRLPDDGSFVGGTLNFTGAGSQTVRWTWHMNPDSIMGIDRKVWITTISPTGSIHQWLPPLMFNYDCQ